MEKHFHEFTLLTNPPKCRICGKSIDELSEEDKEDKYAINLRFSVDVLFAKPMGISLDERIRTNKIKSAMEIEIDKILDEIIIKYEKKLNDFTNTKNSK